MACANDWQVHFHGSRLGCLLCLRAASCSERGLPVQTVAGTGGATTGAVSGPTPAQCCASAFHGARSALTASFYILVTNSALAAFSAYTSCFSNSTVKSIGLYECEHARSQCSTIWLTLNCARRWPRWRRPRRPPQRRRRRQQRGLNTLATRGCESTEGQVPLHDTRATHDVQSLELVPMV